MVKRVCGPIKGGGGGRNDSLFGCKSEGIPTSHGKREKPNMTLHELGNVCWLGASWEGESM